MKIQSCHFIHLTKLSQTINSLNISRRIGTGNRSAISACTPRKCAISDCFCREYSIQGDCNLFREFRTTEYDITSFNSMWSTGYSTSSGKIVNLFMGIENDFVAVLHFLAFASSRHLC